MYCARARTLHFSALAGATRALHFTTAAGASADRHAKIGERRAANSFLARRAFGGCWTCSYQRLLHVHRLIHTKHPSPRRSFGVRAQPSDLRDMMAFPIQYSLKQRAVRKVELAPGLFLEAEVGVGALFFLKRSRISWIRHPFRLEQQIRHPFLPSPEWPFDVHAHNRHIYMLARVLQQPSCRNIRRRCVYEQPSGVLHFCNTCNVAETFASLVVPQKSLQQRNTVAVVDTCRSSTTVVRRHCLQLRRYNCETEVDGDGLTTAPSPILFGILNVVVACIIVVFIMSTR
uniref:Uncharacterized protein n=1 Tax=Hordeum vulgare subsp. vulgare TaxID=112509 RepID=B8K2B5_HORVV|nr:unknown [Hordeum vulgare subsp. vulgare]